LNKSDTEGARGTFFAEACSGVPPPLFVDAADGRTAIPMKVTDCRVRRAFCRAMISAATSGSVCPLGAQVTRTGDGCSETRDSSSNTINAF
jgi:hypothetical protein